MLIKLFFSNVVAYITKTLMLSFLSSLSLSLHKHIHHFPYFPLGAKSGLDLEYTSVLYIIWVRNRAQREVQDHKDDEPCLMTVTRRLSLVARETGRWWYQKIHSSRRGKRRRSESWYLIQAIIVKEELHIPRTLYWLSLLLVRETKQRGAQQLGWTM